MALAGEAEAVIRVDGRAGRITLNRPKALNAVTYEMVLDIERALKAWEADPAVAVVVIDAAGERAFAAGGDIRDLYERGRAGDFAFGQRFWADEYRVNAYLAGYSKPIVSLVDGIVMGGGVGVASHVSHRVVSERTILAMPECGIGLVPDVGGSLILGRAPGRLGEFLGLTGTRIGAADAILTGFADHAVPSGRLEALAARLTETGDAGAAAEFAVDPAALEDQAVAPFLAGIRPGVDDAFGVATLVDIVAALEGSHEGWAAAALKALRRGCPLSIACALEIIRAARGMKRIEDSLALEYRFSARCTEHGEFLEGIRAAVIDKDRSPRWELAGLEDASPERVAAMLAPLGDLELRL